MDIVARLAKTPAEDTSVEAEAPLPSLRNPSARENLNEELIRLRLENTTLKAQMAALKNALRVFTE
jgi:hypothetical protein